VSSTRRRNRARVLVERVAKPTRDHSGRRRLRATRVTVAFVLVACLCACIDSARIYEGDRRSRDEVAILTDSGCGRVVLVAVDGHERTASGKMPHPWSSYTVEVLPGRHWGTVMWVSAWGEESSAAVAASEIAIGMLSLLNPGSFNAVSGKRPVPSSYGSQRFTFLAQAGHKYRIRQGDGPRKDASPAQRRCWMYIWRVTVQGEEPFDLWLVDETALRDA